MTAGVEIDAGRIAAAVAALPAVAGAHSGRFGEIATLLPGRRIPGVRIRPGDITIGVTGRYPATAARIAADVRAAVGPVGCPVHVRIGDIAAGSQSPSTDRTLRPSFRPVHDCSDFKD